jgi:hypothetical protein
MQNRKPSVGGGKNRRRERRGGVERKGNDDVLDIGSGCVFPNTKCNTNGTKIYNRASGYSAYQTIQIIT